MKSPDKEKDPTMKTLTLELHEMYEVSGDGWVSSILEVIVYAEEIEVAR